MNNYLQNFQKNKQTPIFLIILGFLLVGSVFALDYMAYAQIFEYTILENPLMVEMSKKMYLESSLETVYLGNDVTLSGYYYYNGKPVGNASIAIVDRSTNEVIGFDSTDSQGKFSINWTPKNIGTFQIYARTPSDLIESTTASSNAIIVNVEFIPPNNLLTLSVSSSNPQEKEIIEFYGSYTNDNDPLVNYQIIILDQESGKLIKQTKTDSHGQYSIKENLSLRENTYKIYAMSWDPIENMVLDNSNVVRVKVQPTPIPEPKSEIQPNLILNSLPPRIVEGDVIEITGHVTSYGFSGNRVFVKINDDNLIDRINPEREFSVKWTVTSTDIGDVKIYAECDCDGKNIQSNTQLIKVESATVYTPPSSVNVDAENENQKTPTEEPPWLILGIGGIAAAGGAGIAVKTLMFSKTTMSKTNLLDNKQSDIFHNNENPIDEEQIPMPEVEIEVSWGFEK